MNRKESKENKDTGTASSDVSSPSWEVTDRSVTIDDFAAHPDFSAVEHLVVDAPADVTYPAARHLDLLTIRSRVAELAMRVRGMPERFQRHGLPRQRTRLTIDDLVAGGYWALLGEEPGSEVVFGAIGRFWTPVVRPEPVPPEGFGEYEKPRPGKVVASLSVRPYGRGRSLVSYDLRTTLNDPVTRRVFGVYWHTVTPFIRLIMRATLGAVARDATAGTT